MYMNSNRNKKYIYCPLIVMNFMIKNISKFTNNLLDYAISIMIYSSFTVIIKHLLTKYPPKEGVEDLLDLIERIENKNTGLIY